MRRRGRGTANVAGKDVNGRTEVLKNNPPGEEWKGETGEGVKKRRSSKRLCNGVKTASECIFGGGGEDAKVSGGHPKEREGSETRP